MYLGKVGGTGLHYAKCFIIDFPFHRLISCNFACKDVELTHNTTFSV